MEIYDADLSPIHVEVKPRFSLAQSVPANRRYVFTYRVRMENRGEASARLLFRHWLIHDAGGFDSEVDGEGVVGEQPVLDPGDSHEYQSFCILHSPSGYMEGYYTFSDDQGNQFRVPIPRFSLQAPLPTENTEEMN